jgi:lysophospholipase L1-like esterase
MGWRLTGRRGGRAIGAALAICVAGGTALVLGAPANAATSPTYYVSLGDSYAAGYQPVPALAYLHGFTRTVVALERRRGVELTLENFGCSGATTTSILTSIGCPAALRAHDGAPYSTISQAFAATEFIAAHKGHIGLITVSIGGNDITACVAAASPTTCVAHALVNVTKNVDTLATALRGAAGAGVPIIGLTYPDVVLGAWVHPPIDKAVATESILAFGLLVNPTLKKAYASVGGTFVDVTKATGAYTSLKKTTTLAPYGKIPIAVAKVCTLTWYCAKGDIHPRSNGYALIGQLIVSSLPKRLP